MTKEERRLIQQAYDLQWEALTEHPIGSQAASDRLCRAGALLRRVLDDDKRKEAANV